MDGTDRVMVELVSRPFDRETNPLFPTGCRVAVDGHMGVVVPLKDRPPQGVGFCRLGFEGLPPQAAHRPSQDGLAANVLPVLPEDPDRSQAFREVAAVVLDDVAAAFGRQDNPCRHPAVPTSLGGDLVTLAPGARSVGERAFVVRPLAERDAHQHLQRPPAGGPDVVVRRVSTPAVDHGQRCERLRGAARPLVLQQRPTGVDPRGLSSREIELGQDLPCIAADPKGDPVESPGRRPGGEQFVRRVGRIGAVKPLARLPRGDQPQNSRVRHVGVPWRHRLRLHPLPEVGQSLEPPGVPGGRLQLRLVSGRLDEPPAPPLGVVMAELAESCGSDELPREADPRVQLELLPSTELEEADALVGHPGERGGGLGAAIGSHFSTTFLAKRPTAATVGFNV